MKNQRSVKDRAPKDRAKVVRDLGTRMAAAVRGGGHRRQRDRDDDVAAAWDLTQNKAM